MKARCCVLGCGPNSSERTFPFPPDEDADVRKEWIKAVGRINWEPALTSRVCSKHFVAEDFHHLKKAIRLKKDAIPSIDVGFCDTLKKAKMSAKECVISTCSPKYSEAPFFHFPKDKALCLKWLLSIPKGGWSLNQDSQICSRHFEKADVVVNGDQAWLITGSVPKLYLESSTVCFKETPPPLDIGKLEIEEKSDTTEDTSPDIVAPGTSCSEPEDITPSTSKDVDIDEKGNEVHNVKEDPDNGSGSDLEIIEPEIETYEVSDTSDEGEPPTKPAPPVAKAPVAVTSLNCKLQINEVHSRNNKTVTIKAPGSRTGRVIRGDSKIKCCVPRCGSVAGNPPGVGFHSFPQVGETKLSVRSLDNKLTVHDLFSMWKSLLSVPNIYVDSYVCTRHFTANDYTGNFPVLNKVAVPTQFLPTPVTFAPCQVQDKPATVQPPPLVLLNKSKNPPPILRKPIKPGGLTYASPPIRFPGIPSVNKVVNLTPVVTNRVPPRPTPSKIFRQVRPTAPQYSLPTQTLRPTLPIVRSRPPAPPPPPPPPPIIKKIKLACSITDCVHNQHDENNKAVLFRLPHNIEKCKEWVYTCGHPEWLDKGMITARSMFRICSLHFTSEMFLDPNHKTLKGSAKPIVNVQEPYKKCVVKHCHNYYDRERLHYIGVDFATFPTEPEMFNSWVKSVKNNTGVTAGRIQVTEEDIASFTGAVICSLHFRNSDYIAGPNGKSLSSKAIPTMNLVYVKEAEVREVVTEEPVPAKSIAPPKVPQHDDGDMQYIVPKNRRPYFRSKRGRRKGRRGSLRAPVNVGNTEEMNENKDGEGLDGSQLTLRDEEASEKSSNLSAEGEQIAVDHNEGVVGDDDARTSPAAPSRRVRGGRRSRGGRRGRRSANRQIEEEESDDELNTSSRRRSSRIETLYGLSGRPIRSAVLKRKSFVDSGSENQDSDEESLASKRGRLLRQNSTDSDVSVSVSVRRSLRPRRAAARKKFIVDDSDSEEENMDDEWQQEENSAPMNYGEGVERGHFLDAVLGLEPFQEESDGNTAQLVVNTRPSEQEAVPVDVDAAQQREDETMSADAEEKSNEGMTSQITATNNGTAAGECHEPSANTGSESTVDDIMETSGVPEENVSNDVDKEGIDVPKKVEEGKEEDIEMEDGKEGDSNKNHVESQLPEDSGDAQKEVEERKEENVEMQDGKQGDLDKEKQDGKEGDIDKDLVESCVLQDSGNAPKEVEEEKETEEEKEEAIEMEGGKEENIDKYLVESRVPQDNRTSEDLKMLSKDLKADVPHGPELPFPTEADREFFRSIIPTMAAFNDLQKSELRTTIIATLKEMLNEELNIDVMNSNPLENDCPVST